MAKRSRDVKITMKNQLELVPKVTSVQMHAKWLHTQKTENKMNGNIHRAGINDPTTTSITQLPSG